MKTTHLVLSLLALTALVGCGNSKPGESKEESQPKESESEPVSVSEEESLPVESEEESESTPKETDPLAWQQVGGTAYVNIYGDIGVTLLYNDKEVSNGDYIHLADDRYFDYLGAFSSTSFNFVYVLKSVTATGDEYACIVNPAIEGENVGEYLSDVATEYLKGKNKGYIAISTGSDIRWDKSKSEAMNELIQKQVDALNSLE